MADMLIGLDLGQLSDPTAACVLRRSMAIGPDGRPERDSCGRLQYRFDAIALKRYELGTPYAVIVRHIVDQLHRPEFSPKCRLVLDASGVGRPILEQFRTATRGLPHAEVWAITITGGNTCTPVGPREFNVSKVQLVGAIHSAMGLQRITVPPRLPYADVLKAELANFQVRVTASANEVFAAREGTHDDLVISVALPVWLAGMPFAAMRAPGPDDVSLPRERAAVATELETIREAEEDALCLERGETNDRIRAREAELDRLRIEDPFNDVFQWQWGD